MHNIQYGNSNLKRNIEKILPVTIRLEKSACIKLSLLYIKAATSILSKISRRIIRDKISSPIYTMSKYRCTHFNAKPSLYSITPTLSTFYVYYIIYNEFPKRGFIQNYIATMFSEPTFTKYSECFI